MKSDESAATATVAILFLVAMIVPSVMWQGYVLSIMWGWFIVPTFNLPPLTIPVALGISGIVNFMCPKADCAKEEDDLGIAGTVIKGLIKVFGGPAIFLLFGWIVKQWM